MKSDIIVIGGGASGLMAAYGAASALVKDGRDASVTMLEKMPRPGRKIMITGKGRCNFTNLKEWNEFSAHIRSNPDFVKNAFYNLNPSNMISFFEDNGMSTVVERGERAFPASYRASDVVDTLVNACNAQGVKIVSGCEVRGVEPLEGEWKYSLGCADGGTWLCRRLILATGGLSYPASGSTGDGFIWAAKLGHEITTLFPSLTALVPRGYKRIETPDGLHIDRSNPLAELGKALCGIQLKNVGLSLMIAGRCTDEGLGDVDFTDGGIEGPLGFQMSRKAVKAMINGSKVALVLDLKPGVEPSELGSRVEELKLQIERDPRSRRLGEKEKQRILLGKLMPWELIPAFRQCHKDILAGLKEWMFPIEGYVGYERAVVTAGGVCVDSLLRKTLESRLCPGLYMCGEMLDVDCDTGGYNLQTAFSTGLLAGQSAAKSLL